MSFWVIPFGNWLDLVVDVGVVADDEEDEGGCWDELTVCSSVFGVGSVFVNLKRTKIEASAITPAIAATNRNLDIPNFKFI